MTRPIWIIFFLAVTVLSSASGQKNSDGSSPEEICPCETEESCSGDRHIFGRDPMDIQHFGVLRPCSELEHYPCCPAKPPPPKETKLTAQDLQGFSQAELAQLGITGTASLPLSSQEEHARFLALRQQQQQLPPVNLNQPGALSLPPAGANAPFPALSQAPLARTQAGGRYPGNMPSRSAAPVPAVAGQPRYRPYVHPVPRPVYYYPRMYASNMRYTNPQHFQRP